MINSVSYILLFRFFYIFIRIFIYVLRFSGNDDKFSPVRLFFVTLSLKMKWLLYKTLKSLNNCFVDHVKKLTSINAPSLCTIYVIVILYHLAIGNLLQLTAFL